MEVHPSSDESDKCPSCPHIRYVYNNNYKKINLRKLILGLGLE